MRRADFISGPSGAELWASCAAKGTADRPYVVGCNQLIMGPRERASFPPEPVLPYETDGSPPHVHWRVRAAAPHGSASSTGPWMELDFEPCPCPAAPTPPNR